MKNTKTFFKLLIFAGIFILLGTAGASDLDKIGIAEILSNALLSFSLILVGRFGLAVLKLRNTKRRRMVTTRRKAQHGLPSVA